MANRKKEWFVGVNKDTGEYIHHPLTQGWNRDEYTLLPNTHEFEAVVKFKNFGYGGGSISRQQAVFTDLTTGHDVLMHFKTFEKIIKTQQLNKGILVGRWGFDSYYDVIGIVPRQQSK